MPPILLAFPCRMLRTLVPALALAVWAGPSPAEKADRNKPLNIEADSGRYDDLKQVGTFTGNVVVTKGTLTMRAAQIEVRQAPDGYQHGVASALPGQLATFSQKRDGVDETIRGEAERIEYDGKADTVRFINRAVDHLRQHARGLQRRRRRVGGDAGQSRRARARNADAARCGARRRGVAAGGGAAASPQRLARQAGVRSASLRAAIRGVSR